MLLISYLPSQKIETLNVIYAHVLATPDIGNQQNIFSSAAP